MQEQPKLDALLEIQLKSCLALVSFTPDSLHSYPYHPTKPPIPYTVDIMVELGYPVILVHGFMDIPALTGVWKEAEHVLKQYNIVYFTPQIPSYGSIEERTKSLIGKIQQRFPKRKDGKPNYVHIFGHSMVRDSPSESVQ
jgi:hypothetical protein